MTNMSAGLKCMLFIVLFTVVSQLGLSVFNALFRRRKWVGGNEVAGLMFAAQSLIYSLILAFVIVAVWGDYEELNDTIEKEADKLNSILSHSSTLPDSLKQPLSNALFSYCNQIVNNEWMMQEGESDHRPSAIPALRLMLLRREPQDKLQESVFSVIDEDLSEISDLRRDRLDHNRSHVPTLVWFILEAGSLMLILFSYFLYTPSLFLKRVYLCFLSGTIAMSLFLVYSLDHPYRGSSEVSKKAYENVLAELEQQWIVRDRVAAE